MKKVVLNHAALAVPVEVAWQRVAGDGPDRYVVHVGDETLDVAVTRTGSGTGVLHRRQRALPYYAVRRENRVQVWIDGRTHEFEITDDRRKRSAVAGAEIADLRAPMPGTVLAVRVAAGDVFAAHDPLVILESMKMEMTLSAPAAGRVNEVLCRDGELVEMGALLLKLSGADDADVS